MDDTQIDAALKAALMAIDAAAPAAVDRPFEIRVLQAAERRAFQARSLTYGLYGLLSLGVLAVLTPALGLLISHISLDWVMEVLISVAGIYGLVLSERETGLGRYLIRQAERLVG